MPDAWRAEHWSANAAGTGAQPAGALEARAVFTGRTRGTSVGAAEEEGR
jgi:hypothetical protein